MRAHPVGHPLDHRGTATGPRLVHGGLRGGVHREEIVAVESDAVHAVRPGLLGQGFRRGLFRDGDRDRPLIVLAEEDRRRLEHAGEVHPRVEVAFARRAVPEVRQADGVLLADLRSPGRADGLCDLRPNRTRGRDVADAGGSEVVRHLTAVLRILGVPVGLGDQRLEGESPPDGGPGLAVRREDPVPLLEGHRAPNLARLLSRARHVETDSTLALQREHARVERPDQDEVAIRRLQDFRRELRFHLGIIRPVHVDDAEHAFFGRPLTPANLAVVPG